MSPSNNLISPEAVLAANGKSFSFAGHLLDSSTLNACARLYRFCRYVDDLVDSSIDASQAHTQLLTIKHELAKGESSTPMVTDFISLSNEFGLDHAVTNELFKGFETDLALVRIQTQDELLRYCYRVAGTVGLHMCSVFGVTGTTARAHAIDLGIAMQLTNICRDVLEDAKQGRRYIPASMATDLQPQDIQHPTTEHAALITRTVAELLLIADTYYKSGVIGYHYLPWRARLSIAVAARVYRGIGGIIKERDNDVWTERAVVSLSCKYKLACRAIFSLLKKNGSPSLHNSDLHRALAGLPNADSPR